MPDTVRVSISCPDRTGLVAAIAGRLFELGGNLSDTTFAVLGGGAEFTTVCELSEDAAPGSIEAELRRLPELEDAAISVTPFDLSPVHGPSGRITHRIVVSGGDRPGLIARLCEVFVQFKANVVRLNSQRIPRAGSVDYVIDIAISVADERAQSCLATTVNTAGELGLTCHWERVG